MKNIFLLILATIFIGITSNAQNTLFPNYSAQGSPTTLNDFRGGLRTIKGLVNGRYFDTTAANNDPYIRAYAGAQIYTTKDSSIWIRNNPATRWMLQLNESSDIITNIYNSSVVSVTNLNDSTVIICYGDGTCDTINTTGSTITNINNSYFIGDSLLVICDTTQSICVGDSCYTTTLCDTITVDRQRLFLFQNGVRQLGTSLLVEHGNERIPGFSLNTGPISAWFKHPTTLNTFVFDYTITGYPVWRPILEVIQQQTWGVSSQIATFKSVGSGIDTATDFNNQVRLNIGYFSNRYGSGPASDIDTGYLGQDIAYYIGTNGSTAGSYGWQFDDPYSKHSGIAFNTKDTLSSVVLTFYGGRPPLTYLDGPLGFDEILNDKRILTLDYNKDARWFGYPNTRDDGANPQVGYGLYVDVDGYMKYGFIGGGGGGGGTDNFNLGAGFRLVVPSSQGVKTLFVAGDLTIDSTSNTNGITITGTGITSITADDGLTASSATNVKLGSGSAPGAAFLSNRFIDAGSSFNLTMTGTLSGNGSGILVVDNTLSTGTAGVAIRGTTASSNTSAYAINGVASSAGIGVRGVSLSGIGVSGTSTSNFGVVGSSQSGVGVEGVSTTSVGGLFSSSPTSTNTSTQIVNLIRSISGGGTPTTGFGGYIGFDLTVDNLTTQVAGRLGYVWSNAVLTTRSSQYEIHAVDAAVMARKAMLSAAGRWTWDTYGVGTHTGTAAYTLQVDANGNVIEGAVGITGVSADNGLTENVSNNIQLGSTTNSGSPLLHDTYINTDAYILNVSNTSTGVTSNKKVLQVLNSGATFDATAGNITSFLGYFANTSTRSAGANNLTNIGVYATASGGQINYAAYFDGSVSTDVSASTSSTVRISGSASHSTIFTIQDGSATNLFRVSGSGQLFAENYGINTFAGTPAYTLGVDANGNVVEFTSGGGSVKLNSIIAADGNNTINNGSTFHNWQWNSLGSNYAVNLSTTSASQNGSRMMDITMSGTSSGTSSGIWIRNQNGGTGHNIGLEIDNAGGANNTGILVDVDGTGLTTAIGLQVTVASATNNYAIIVPTSGGFTGLGTSTPSTVLHVNGASGFRYVDGNQGANKILVSDGNGVGTWTTPTFGTVSSGTQYQMGFYAANGTTISGNSGIVTNANNGLYITSSDDAPFKVTATGTGIAGQYFQLGKFLASNIGGGDIAQYFVGKQESSNDSYSIDYVHSADGSTSNYMGLGFYANNDKVKIYASGNVGIGLAGAPGERLVVSGNIQTNTGYLKLNDMTAPGTAESNYINIYMNSDKTFSITDGGVVNRLENAFNPLTTNTTTVGNVGTGEDDLMTYSIPAGKLAADGDYVEFEMTFSFAANANAKQVKVYFGATQLYASGSQTQNGGNMVIRGKITRTGATSQRISVTAVNNTTNFVDESSYVTASETLSGALTLKGTGEAVSNDDITQVTNIVSYIRLN